MPLATPRIVRLANLTVVVGALVCAALLGISASRPHEELSRGEVIGGYLLPGAWLVAFLVAAKLSVGNRINFVLTILSVTFGIYIAECVVAFRLPIFITEHSALKSDATIDTRTKLEALLEMRAKGERVFPHLSGPLLSEAPIVVNGRRVMPLSPSPANATVVFCNETGQYVRYESDEHGFNNPKGLWGAKAIDIVLIGDSFVHGACVESAMTIAGRLRSRWPATLSLGVSGAGPLFELAVLREYATEIRPNVVVWFFFEGNDLSDLHREQQVPELSAYVQEGHRQHLIMYQEGIDEGLAAIVDRIVERQQQERHVSWSFERWVSETSRIAVLSNLRAVLGIRLPRKDHSVDPFPVLIREAKKSVQSWGGTLYFAYLPTYERYSEWLGDGPVERGAVLKAVQEAGVEIIDVHRIFASYSNPRSFWVHPNAHYTLDGYRIIADAIREHLAPRPLSAGSL